VAADALAAPAASTAAAAVAMRSVRGMAAASRRGGVASVTALTGAR
jgi:hypothetical protein